MGGGTETISWNLGLGCVYSLNLEFPVCESADSALAHGLGMECRRKNDHFRPFLDHFRPISVCLNTNPATHGSFIDFRLTWGVHTLPPGPFQLMSAAQRLPSRVLGHFWHRRGV